jgi:aspartate aminotransferase
MVYSRAMDDGVRTRVDLTGLARDAGPRPDARASRMARGLIGSEILRIAAEIRGLVAAGKTVCDLTVGDFSPRQFPIPGVLRDAISEALGRGETNYPPSNGMAELRRAIRDFYAREFGFDYPVESVLVTGGSRPAIYAAYRTLCDPGDRVVYPVPSWNNDHYCHLVGAERVPIACRPEERFLPSREALEAALPGARLLCLNSPVNPAGTAMSRETLAAVCQAVLEENARREGAGERPLYLLYDQVYWTLCFGSTTHVSPLEIAPELARYTLLVDGISKAFAATGVRVGWAVGPVDVIARMSALMGHVGAWAPRAEQIATVALLDDPAAIRAFQAVFKKGVEARLDRLHLGLVELKRQGLPVDAIPPMGAIYLTARLHPFGRNSPAGRPLKSNDDVRQYVLDAAGIGVVPFQAFGCREDDGWFRLSVGAVSEADIDAALPRLAEALRVLR